MSSKQIEIHKNRTNNIVVNLGIDVSSDTFASEIRKEKDWNSTLIATFTWAFATDGIDGLIILTLDNTISSAITATNGYMDVKRITNGEPVSVFSAPIEVAFIGTVTA